MNIKAIAIVTALACAICLLPSASAAQTLGTFRWQLSPFCNVLTLSVVQQGSIFVLSGFDDRCGASTVASATGTAFFNPDGTVGMGLTIVGAGGVAIAQAVQLSSSTLSGAWASGGMSGDFTFNPPPSPAGAARSELVDSVFAYGQIRESASIRNGSSRVVTVDHPATGLYCVTFSPVPTQTQLEGAVVGLSGSGSTTRFARVSNGQGGGCASGQLRIQTVDGDGDPADARFTFIVP